MPCTDQRIQKLDEDSLRNLTEGTGPCNECICNLIVPPKEPFNLRNKLRSACTTIHMCKDSTAKRLRGKGPNNLAGCSEEESGSGGKAGKAGKPGKEQKSKGKK